MLLFFCTFRWCKSWFGSSWHFSMFIICGIPIASIWMSLTFCTFGWCRSWWCEFVACSCVYNMWYLTCLPNGSMYVTEISQIQMMQFVMVWVRDWFVFSHICGISTASIYRCYWDFASSDDAVRDFAHVDDEVRERCVIRTASIYISPTFCIFRWCSSWLCTFRWRKSWKMRYLNCLL